MKIKRITNKAKRSTNLKYKLKIILFIFNGRIINSFVHVITGIRFMSVRSKNIILNDLLNVHSL
jgi:hypothetical protein